jgi:hypothetical protein
VLTRVRRSPLLLASFALLALTLLPRDAAAIPPFARKYGVSCALCHQPVPRLTAFGETFASNGFEMAIGEDPRDTVGTGDPMLRLQRTFPIGVRVDAYQRLLSKKAAGEATVDQQVPWTVKVLSGGQIADKVSYYVYFLASERGEVGGLEDAYVQFTDIKGSGVSLLVGQFQVSDPLLKRELRLPYEDYQPYRVRVGDTRADLTYERGLMALWSPREGTDVAVQVVNGQGLGAANSARQYDLDSDKSFVLRVSQDVGPLRLGVFGYTGSEGAEGAKSRIRYFGPDATIALGANTEINLQLMRRWDSDPFLGSCSVLTPCPGGATAPFSTRVNAAIAELIYSPGGPGGRWFVSGLFNFVEADAPVVSLRLGEQDSPDGFLTRYRTGAFGVHYLLKRNIRLMTEAGWNVDREQARVLTGFTLGF